MDCLTIEKELFLSNIVPMEDENRSGKRQQRIDEEQAIIYRCLPEEVHHWHSSNSKLGDSEYNFPCSVDFDSGP
jgi:hypothetical protein